MKNITLIILTLLTMLLYSSCASQRQLTYEEQEELRYEEYWKSIEEHIINIKQ